jgi:hypothetical protein
MERVPEGYNPDQELKCSRKMLCPSADLLSGILVSAVGAGLFGYGVDIANTTPADVVTPEAGALLGSAILVVGFGISLFVSSEYGHGYAIECRNAMEEHERWLKIQNKVNLGNGQERENEM